MPSINDSTDKFLAKFIPQYRFMSEIEKLKKDIFTTDILKTIVNEESNSFAASKCKMTFQERLEFKRK